MCRTRDQKPKKKKETPSWRTKPLVEVISENNQIRSSGSGPFPPACLSWKAGKRARARAPIPEEVPAAGTEEPEGATATGSEGPGETGAAGVLGEIMAIHARDGQVQGLCSLVAHLGNGSCLGHVHENEHFSTHLSVEKEETRSRRGAKAV